MLGSIHPHGPTTNTRMELTNSEDRTANRGDGSLREDLRQILVDITKNQMATDGVECFALLSSHMCADFAERRGKRQGSDNPGLKYGKCTLTIKVSANWRLIAWTLMGETALKIPQRNILTGTKKHKSS